MDSQIVDAVTEWDTVSFGGGYDGLHDLAATEFSGAVQANSVWAFMLNGRVIGVVDGSLSAFESAGGTAYDAPDSSLPLLYTMQAQGGDEQAEYYTKDTPISEADTTLSSGNFTGYIELSENVLSGDYYIVYYGGRSMSAAFVGNSRRLLTGDEAFERADDEVGIYRVFAADIDVVDIPETSAAETTATSDTATASGRDDTPTATSTSDEPAAGDNSQNHPSSTSTSRRPADLATDTAANGGGTAATTDNESETTAAGSTADTSTTAASSTQTDTEEASSESYESVSPTDAGTETDTGGSDADSSGESTATTESAATASSQESNRFSEESEWQNTTTIPSLNPDEGGKSARRQASGGAQLTQKPTQSKSDDTEGKPSRQQLAKRLQEAEVVMEKAEKRHKDLIEARDAAREERAAAREERDAAKTKLAELEAELADAEAKIEELEEELADARAAADAEPTPAAASTAAVESSHTLDPVSALEGTNLFVRYDSKGTATLDTAHDGGADPAALDENLRIDHHTTFDTAGLTVDGDPFEAFLEDRIEVAFANWIVRDLLFDIQGTGTQSGMQRIYDAIPMIDRIELRGTVDLGTDEDDDPVEIPYDLIVRDKHGNPLFVATFEESNESVGAPVVEELIQDGNDIRQREQEFVAGFTVTTSYFDPGALEAAENATSGGFLSRSRGKSFVSVSRKQGFHLCLVDRIDDGFDLRVPEL